MLADLAVLLLAMYGRFVPVSSVQVVALME